MNTLTQAQHLKPSKKRYVYEWYVVLLCMVAYIFSFVDRQILALMIEPIKADLQTQRYPVQPAARPGVFVVLRLHGHAHRLPGRPLLAAEASSPSAWWSGAS